MNVLKVIHPYRYEGLWVFDDPQAGLCQEPLIAGTDQIIERAVAAKGIRNPEAGFRLMFSATPFPGYDYKFTWRREGDGGNWYYSEDFQMEGWLCPALFKYFEGAPREIYAKFESRSTDPAPR